MYSMNLDWITTYRQSKAFEALRTLMSRGNSLLVVEHDAETIEQADYIIDVGPKQVQTEARSFHAGKETLN